MRHGTPTNRRQRGRGNGGGRRSGGNQQRMQVFDSNGPDVRIRGTAHQVNEKYMALAKDAAAAGDTILAESYLQFAEHYQRVINSWEENVQAEPKPASENGSKLKGGDDDLSLPSSILGGNSKVGADMRTAESAVS
ncbi:MAG: DUF4167 domain-containing protein [Alphaproteobacteria bacterium]